MSQPGTLILEVPCPTCGAHPGEPCQGTTARAAKRYGAGHEARALASRNYGASLQEAPGSTETAGTPHPAPEYSPPGDPGRAAPPRGDSGPRPADSRPWPRRPGP